MPIRSIVRRRLSKAYFSLSDCTSPCLGRAGCCSCCLLLHAVVTALTRYCMRAFTVCGWPPRFVAFDVEHNAAHLVVGARTWLRRLPLCYHINDDVQRGCDGCHYTIVLWSRDHLPLHTLHCCLCSRIIILHLNNSNYNINNKHYYYYYNCLLIWCTLQRQM